jgi:hypothetical protein
LERVGRTNLDMLILIDLGVVGVKLKMVFSFTYIFLVFFS